MKVHPTLRTLWPLPLGLVAAAAAMYWAWPFFHDDAFITLRYAQRALDGKGLTWTAGEPVEGFTHPLWLMQLIALGGLGVDLEQATRVLSAGYLLALVALWWRAKLWMPALLLLLLNPALATWSAGGLETVSFAFWCVASGWLAHRFATQGGNARWAVGMGLCFAACTLTRPEGTAVALIALAWCALHRRSWPWAALGYAVPVGSYLAFRLHYYGDWLPNTAYAKLGGLERSALLERAGTYLLERQTLWWPLVIALTLTLILRATRALPARVPFRPVLLSLGLATPLLASCVWAGGDHMTQHRLLVPVYALGSLALSLAVVGCRDRRWLAALTLVGCGFHGHQLYETRAAVERDVAAELGEAVGRFLGERLGEGTRVAVATAGSTPYFAPHLEFIDTLGLNDRHIARRNPVPLRTHWQRAAGHLKGDGAYVLAQRPDVIILGPAYGDTGCRSRAWFLGDYELIKLPGFRKRYQLYRFAIEPTRKPMSNNTERRLRTGTFPLHAYLARDSKRLGDLKKQGRTPKPPWRNKRCR